MESLADIMGGRSYTPPSEVELIMDYVLRRYKTTCRVYVTNEKITVRVKSSALANTLRLEQKHMIEACSLDKKLNIQIG